MKILIVDDEAPARRRLQQLLEGHEVLQAASGREAVGIARAAGPDVALLDIRMPGMDGLELARHLHVLPAPPAIIFVTAFEAHALKAFETNAVDYLLKPVQPMRLAEAIQRVRILRRGQLAALRELRQGPRSHLSVADATGVQMIPVDQVRAFQATQKHVTVLWPGPPLLVNESLRELEQEFAASFVRVHRSALAALAHVTLLESGAGRPPRLHLDGLDAHLPVSRRCLPALRRRLKLVRRPPQRVS